MGAVGQLECPSPHVVTGWEARTWGHGVGGVGPGAGGGGPLWGGGDI